MNRGVCQLDSKGDLASITERLNISEQEGGKIICDDNLEPREISRESKVSMNFWCFSPYVFDFSEELFSDFLDNYINVPKSEFFIPIVADKYIHQGKGVIKVIPTSSSWFGVTYKQDAPAVKAAIDELVDSGEYPGGLWGQ